MSNSSSNLPVSNDIELLNGDNAGGQHSDGTPGSIIDELSDYDNHDVEEQDVKPSSKKRSRTQSPIWELFHQRCKPAQCQVKHLQALQNAHQLP